MLNANERVFKAMKGLGYQVLVYNELGQETYDPSEGVRFFSLKPNLMVSVVGDEITLNKSSSIPVEDIKSLINHLKIISREMMMSYEFKIFGKEIVPKDFAYQAKITKKKRTMSESFQDSALRAKFENILRSAPEQDQELVKMLYLTKAKDGMAEYYDRVYGFLTPETKAQVDLAIGNQESEMKNTTVETITESLSKLFGKVKTSYQMLGEVKLIFRHRVPVNEESPQSRIRNIKEIYIESASGRQKFPCVFLDGARAMARHINEGGSFEDLAGQQIVETSMKFKKLQEFMRYSAKNNLLNEDNVKTMRLVEKTLRQIKEDFKSFYKTRNYESVKEMFETQRLQELANERVDELRDRFTVKYFDQQMEDVLPLINNILQERDTYISSLKEEINILEFADVPEVPKGLLFDSINDQIAFLMSESSKYINGESLKSFFTNMSEKISSGYQLDEEEVDIIKEAIAKLSLARAPKEPAPGLYESILLEIKSCFSEENCEEELLVPKKTNVTDKEQTLRDISLSHKKGNRMMAGGESKVDEVAPLVGMAARVAAPMVGSAIGSAIGSMGGSDNSGDISEGGRETVHLYSKPEFGDDMIMFVPSSYAYDKLSDEFLKEKIPYQISQESDGFLIVSKEHAERARDLLDTVLVDFDVDDKYAQSEGAVGAVAGAALGGVLSRNRKGVVTGARLGDKAEEFAKSAYHKLKSQKDN